MKQKSGRKLKLKRLTLANLNSSNLEKVVGGTLPTRWMTNCQSKTLWCPINSGCQSQCVSVCRSCGPQSECCPNTHLEEGCTVSEVGCGNTTNDQMAC